MRKVLLIAAAATALAAPALADEVGVEVRPGVTVGESHRVVVPEESRKTVIKKEEPGSQTTVIKKEHSDGSESKTVIHREND